MAKRNRSSDAKSRGKKHRNIFYRSKNSSDKLSASIDPDDENSLYQDWSMQALQSRGVQFLSCHTAAEEQARVLFRRNKLSDHQRTSWRPCSHIHSRGFLWLRDDRCPCAAPGSRPLHLYFRVAQ